MRFDILTLFPDAYTSYFNSSMMKRAQTSKRVDIRVHNIRDYTTDKHRTADDRPYGGGAGMVMKVEPIFKAVKALKKKQETRNKKQTKVYLTSPRGKQFDQRMAEKFAKLGQLVLIAGHYEGVDERVKKFIDGEISVGPYVLTGGELPAMTIVDAVTRLIPGVLGNADSLNEESFGEISNRRFKIADFKRKKNHKSKIINRTSKEYPQYTRPEVFLPKKGVQWRVPKVLLSGDHKNIEIWRRKGVKRGKA